MSKKLSNARAFVLGGEIQERLNELRNNIEALTAVESSARQLRWAAEARSGKIPVAAPGSVSEAQVEAASGKGQDT